MDFILNLGSIYSIGFYIMGYVFTLGNTGWAHLFGLSLAPWWEHMIKEVFLLFLALPKFKFKFECFVLETCNSSLGTFWELQGRAYLLWKCYNSSIGKVKTQRNYLLTLFSISSIKEKKYYGI